MKVYQTWSDQFSFAQSDLTKVKIYNMENKIWEPTPTIKRIKSKFKKCEENISIIHSVVLPENDVIVLFHIDASNLNYDDFMIEPIIGDLYYINTASFHIEKRVRLSSMFPFIYTYCTYKHLIFIVTTESILYSYDLFTGMLKQIGCLQDDKNKYIKIRNIQTTDLVLALLFNRDARVSCGNKLLNIKKLYENLDEADFDLKSIVEDDCSYLDFVLDQEMAHMICV